MTDLALRSLERTWRASGLVADLAALLRRRRQVGQLYRSQLELAAYCGSQAARIALEVENCGDCRAQSVCPRGLSRCPSVHDDQDLGTWLELLQFWPQAELRAGIAAARLTLPIWEAGPASWCRHCTGPGQGCPYCWVPDPLRPSRSVQHGPRRAIEAAEDCLPDPQDPNRLRAITAGRQVWVETPWAAGPARALNNQHELFALAVIGAASVVGPDGRPLIRRAVQDALIDWALEEPNG